MLIVYFILSLYFNFLVVIFGFILGIVSMEYFMICRRNLKILGVIVIIEKKKMRF